MLASNALDCNVRILRVAFLEAVQYTRRKYSGSCQAMAEQVIRLTKVQAIRIMRETAYRVPRDIEYPWACICCGRPSREVLDCMHAVDCSIGVIRAQLSEEERRSAASEEGVRGP